MTAEQTLHPRTVGELLEILRQIPADVPLGQGYHPQEAESFLYIADEPAGDYAGIDVVLELRGRVTANAGEATS